MGDINSGMAQGIKVLGVVLAGVLGIKFLATLLPGILTDINTTIASLTGFDSDAGSIAGVVWIIFGIVVLVAGINLVDRLMSRS